MNTYSTYPQYLADCTDRTVNSHRPPSVPYLWTCDACGKASPHTDGHGVSGHAMHCYACCADHDRAEMFDRSKPFVCYLSSDGRHVTSWPGGILGDVTWSKKSRTGFHGSKVTRVNVRDVHGGYWYGQGSGNGMCIKLYPMRDPDAPVLRKGQIWYFVEMTDTYGGEANYYWVNRFMVSASSERGAIGKVTRRTGTHAESVGAGRYDAIGGACICYFVEWIDDDRRAEMLSNYSRLLIEVL